MSAFTELKGCPFCGGKSRLSTVGRGWYRITSDHADSCLLEGQEFDAPQTDEQLSLLVRDWNWRSNSEGIHPDQYEALKKDAERFEFIASDAESTLEKIYGDDWLAVVDAAMSAGQ